MIAFQDDVFTDAVEPLAAAAYRGAADTEVVLATSGRASGGNADSWVQEWTATAGSAWAAAKASQAAGQQISALAHYRRAANYYAVAVAVVRYSTERERHYALWRRQRDCWERSIALLSNPGTRIEIPYERTALPGYLFSGGRGRRPLVIVVHGDGPTSHGWLYGGAAASERGYHWMTFDGPGQEAALFDQRLALRPDWEAVLTPLINTMSAHDAIDRQRIAVIATGEAGFLVIRALTSEHRLAAAVTDPEALDPADAWIAALPAHMRRQLHEGDRSGFDRDMRLAELIEPALTARLAVCGAPYALDERSRYQLFKTVEGFRLNAGLQQITTPVLVTDASRRRYPGQAQQLAARLTGPVDLLQFGDEDPVPAGMRDSRVMDWLDAHLR